jgi:transposase
MIQLNPQTKIYCAIEAVDFRKGIDGLARVCQEALGQDPFCGSVFVFRNRRRTGIRILTYDGQGFWLCMKRLSQGRFGWWGLAEGMNQRTLELLMSELQVLLWNGNPERSRVNKLWRKVA